MKLFVVVLLALSAFSASALPQRNSPLPRDEQAEVDAQAAEDETGFKAVRTIEHCTTGEIIPVDIASIDANGCLVGPCGDRVCPTGSIGVGNDSASFRGNKGPRNTGSNGNAGPVGADGRPVNPAEVSYLAQIERYKQWELQQLENNKKIQG